MKTRLLFGWGGEGAISHASQKNKEEDRLRSLCLWEKEEKGQIFIYCGGGGERKTPMRKGGGGLQLFSKRKESTWENVKGRARTEWSRDRRGGGGGEKRAVSWHRAKSVGMRPRSGGWKDRVRSVWGGRGEESRC